MGGSLVVVSMIGPLIALCLLAGCVFMIWRTLTLPRGTRREPVCESCGYAVTELAGFTCPECGSDLRRVGIVTPAMEARRRGSLPGAILAWTILCAIFGLVLLAVGSLTVRSVGMINTTMHYRLTLTPVGGGYRSVDVQYDTDGMSIGEIDLLLTLEDGSEHPLRLDTGPMLVTGLPEGEAPWGEETIPAWFAGAGLDDGESETAARAADVRQYVESVIASPTSGPAGSPSRHGLTLTSISMAGAGDPASAGVVGTVLLGIGGLGLAIYIGGIVVIVRRRRRLLRSAGAA